VPTKDRPGKRREIMDYVESQIRDPKIKATHAAFLETKRLDTRRYDLWEVDTSDGESWWVITNLTNYYSKRDHPDRDVAFSLHLGIMQRLRARQDAEHIPGSPAEKDRLAAVWRRWQQAGEALDLADEAEEFMAVGMRCRTALLAFAKEVAKPEWVPEGQKAPKRGDFVGWADVVADRVAGDRLRALLKGMAKHTWDYVQALTHDEEATLVDGTMAVAATADVIGLYGLALVRYERGVPARCPKCGSYRLDTEYRPELPAADPYVTYCEACEWQEEPEPDVDWDEDGDAYRRR
jgi:hypothetical protein